MVITVVVAVEQERLEQLLLLHPKLAALAALV
jgi:hypothetical protein